MRTTALFLLLIIAGAPSSSFGQQPQALAVLQQGIDQAIRVLENPRFQGAERKKEQQQKLWEIMLEFFDFKEFSIKVLGPYWKKFDPLQKDEFVRVFGEFLGKFYLGRLQDRYNKERVIYLGQHLIGDSQALVEIEVLWRDLKVPVKLRMTNRSGKWKVYDLSVMGIDAASNYRAQFKWILSRESPQQIIGRLKEKIAKLDEKS
jgi:phospholipid transport system substrate-binding protein